jgi:hypothetical protein
VPGIHPEHGDVGARVAPDDLGRQHRAVFHGDADGGGVAHHVVVGDDGSVGIDDEAGAAGLDGAGALVLLGHHAKGQPERHLRAFGRVVALVLAEAFGGVGTGFEHRGDRDDGGLDLFHQAGKVWQALGRALRLDGTCLVRGVGSARRRGEATVGEGEAGQRGAGKQHGGQGVAQRVAALGWREMGHGVCDPVSGVQGNRRIRRSNLQMASASGRFSRGPMKPVSSSGSSGAAIFRRGRRFC